MVYLEVFKGHRNWVARAMRGNEILDSVSDESRTIAVSTLMFSRNDISHVKLPDGSLDDGDSLSLLEVVDAVYGAE